MVDTSNFLESFTIQPNFDYFQTRDFHKLIQKKQAQNNFSILHTNICSLYANAEYLEMLINRLEHTFSVFTQGTTTKSGCGFDVKKGLKFKSRRGLDLTYHDDENEIQS